MEQTKDNRLEQVKLLHTLAEDFDRFNEMYKKARPNLAEFQKIPKKMTEEEWGRVVDALDECHQSVKFLYRIALLTESGVIDKDLLYVFYYDEIADNITFKLSHLIKWCGTGLDLAANYDSYQLAHIAITLIQLIKDLDAFHREHYADLEVWGHEGIINLFNEKTKDFFSDPGKFNVCSANYLDNRLIVFKKSSDRHQLNWR